MERIKKKQIITNLNKKLKNIEFLILVNYLGMNVRKIETLRKELRKFDSEIKIIKNTLFRIALKNTNFISFENFLKGPLAIIFNKKNNNIIKITKSVVNFAKNNPELNIKIGLLEGRICDQNKIKSFAELPNKEVLLVKLLFIMINNQINLINFFKKIPQNFVQILEAFYSKRKQKKEA